MNRSTAWLYCIVLSIWNRFFKRREWRCIPIDVE